MGTIKSSPPGVELRSGVQSESIRIKFMYRGTECRETLKLAHSKANIKYAERLRGEILNAIAMGNFSYTKYFPDSTQLKKFGLQSRQHSVTVGDLLRQQFEIYERILAPSTLKSYRGILTTRLLPQWGDTMLSELSPAALRAWISGMGIKAASTRQVLIPLRGALELAINDDLIDVNPLDRVRLQKTLDRDAYKAEYEVDPFSAQEIAAILGSAQGQARNVFQFAFYTGMRPSEYIALRWDSIDWTGFKAKVERSRVMGISREELKTRAGRRLVELRRGAVEALVAQKQHSFLAGGLVFQDPATGEGWDNTQRLSLFWAQMIKKGKVRYRNPYQTRHTFASTLLSTGANPMYVAKQMGHTDTTMITRTYGRWLEQEGGVLPDLYLKMADGLKEGTA
ncbi:Arm DNA-binding domain-containing protein [Janthinobacterium sp. GB1R12]|uniref:Arm DNA-binding domain-containing protein n=1 Tax=Janthinobacterium sp. GB1R12 TaxID=3424190 RepID=UPI003F278DA2